jgi:hypothetical protein
MRKYRSFDLPVQDEADLIEAQLWRSCARHYTVLDYFHSHKNRRCMSSVESMK